MNTRKPSRSFSGDRKKSSYKDTDKEKARKDRKGEYYGKSKRIASERNFDKPKQGYIKDNTEKPRGEHFKKEGAERSFDKPRRSFDKDSSDKPRRSFNNDTHSGERDKFKKRFTSDKEEGKKSFNRPSKSFSKDRNEKGFDKPRRSFDKDSSEKSFEKPKFEGYREDKDTSIKGKRSFSKDDSDKPRKSFDKDGKSFHKGYEKKYKEKRFYKKDFSKKKEEKPTFADQGLTRLNKYIANAGICSRREADDLIKSGCVSVNGKVISELGFKVKEGDEVTYSGSKIKTEKPVYLLLNKPKDYLTTVSDDRGRRTVMELIDGACKERIYPVGRLDRNTTGLLLFTNDGEMTKKLTHPKHDVQKLYHVELDKNLKQTDLLKIRDGVELEDGPIKPDEVSYAGESKREVGILIHSGRNRIVRRIFEHLEYEVIKLDRVMFAGLTKKNLPKGRWRFLTESEVSFLKMV